MFSEVDMYSNRLDELLCGHARACGMTFEEVAGRLGCTRRHLQDVRRGKAEMTFAEAHEMAVFLGISLDRLYLLAPHH